MKGLYSALQLSHESTSTIRQRCQKCENMDIHDRLHCTVVFMKECSKKDRQTVSKIMKDLPPITRGFISEINILEVKDTKTVIACIESEVVGDIEMLFEYIQRKTDGDINQRSFEFYPHITLSYLTGEISPSLNNLIGLEVEFDEIIIEDFDDTKVFKKNKTQTQEVK